VFKYLLPPNLKPRPNFLFCEYNIKELNKLIIFQEYLVIQTRSNDHGFPFSWSLLTTVHGGLDYMIYVCLPSLFPPIRSFAHSLHPFHLCRHLVPFFGFFPCSTRLHSGKKTKHQVRPFLIVAAQTGRSGSKRGNKYRCGEILEGMAVVRKIALLK